MSYENIPIGEMPLRLPPPEVWIFSPKKGERLPTPVDERGLVDTKQLIALIRSTVDSEFGWEPSEKPNKHHLYWERNRYPDIADTATNPYTFCNLASSQILIPRMFHNWLHLVTEQPPAPSEEVMHYQVKAEHVARILFKNARQMEGLLSSSNITMERLTRGLDHHLGQFCLKLEEARGLPLEFQPINFHDYGEPSTIDEVHVIAQRLGEVAIGADNRVQYIRLNAA